MSFLEFALPCPATAFGSFYTSHLFCSKINFRKLRKLLFGIFHILPEKCRGWHSLAGNVHSQQIGIILAKIRHQTAHLARRAGKQRLASRLQNMAQLAEAIAHIALHIFGAGHFPYYSLVIGDNMPGHKIAIQYTAADMAAFFQNSPRQNGEHAAGAGIDDFRLIGIDSAVKIILVWIFIRLVDRANLRAQITIHAFALINGREKKSLFIRLHAYGALRANGITGGAASALGAVLIYHRVFLLF